MVSGYNKFTKVNTMPQKKTELVGDSNHVEVLVNGTPVLGLVDTGSQITSITHKFLQESLRKVPILELKNVITIRGAGGHVLPYIGYVDLEFEIGGDNYFAPVLVVPGNFTDDIPLIIGTNILKLVYDSGKDMNDSDLQLPLRNVLINMAKTDVDVIGTVKSSQ